MIVIKTSRLLSNTGFTFNTHLKSFKLLSCLIFEDWLPKLLTFPKYLLIIESSQHLITYYYFYFTDEATEVQKG